MEVRMNRVKLVLLVAISIALTFTFIGCSRYTIKNASLSKGTPENFFEDKKIEADDSKSVSYTFESKIADPFPFYDYRLDLNQSYKAVLNNYMNYKYTTVDSEDGGYHIDVILENCTGVAEPAGKQTAYSDHTSNSASVYFAKIITEIVVKVRVNVNGKVSEKNITSSGEFTGPNEEYNTITTSFDLAIRATISQIDKFLNSALN
jgi:hypothetical protein